MRFAALLSMLLCSTAIAAEPTYFAEIDAGGTVQNVIVATPEFIARLPGTFVQTWVDGGKRKNYAGRGYKYDKALDAFVAPKPYPSWKLNAATGRWESPVPLPANQREVDWDEKTKAWVKMRR